MAATDVALSVLCVPEIVSALNRRVRERVVSARQYEQARHWLYQDVHDATIINLTQRLVAAYKNSPSFSWVTKSSVKAPHWRTRRQWRSYTRRLQN